MVGRWSRNSAAEEIFLKCVKLTSFIGIWGKLLFFFFQPSWPSGPQVFNFLEGRQMRSEISDRQQFWLSLCLLTFSENNINNITVGRMSRPISIFLSFFLKFGWILIFSPIYFCNHIFFAVTKNNFFQCEAAALARLSRWQKLRYLTIISIITSQKMAFNRTTGRSVNL